MRSKHEAVHILLINFENNLINAFSNHTYCLNLLSHVLPHEIEIAKKIENAQKVVDRKETANK